MTYHGSCHCGALSLTYHTDLAVEDWSVRSCQCPFCRKHGALTTSDPNGKLEFVVDDPERVRRYRFGKRTADFLICTGCGIYVGAVIDTPAGTYGILNVNVLAGVPTRPLEATPVTYDDESERHRVERREQRWTPAFERT